jgi:DNA-binding PadR family transcriptional regulator
MENIYFNTQALPGIIANSIVRIYEDKFFSNLHFSTKQVFSILVRFGLSIKNLHQSIFIKKSTIAKLLNVNEATVYRALSKLEKEKLIEREAQNITSSNLKVIGKIRITKIALEIFGIENYLEQHKVYLKEKYKNTLSYTKGDKDLAQVQDKNNKFSLQSLQKQSDKNFFKEIEGRKIPQDLAWLVEENKLQIGGLLKLMKMAREQGKRLSDIVTVCIHALRKITGRALYAYLRKLINKEYDFAYVKSMQEEEKLEKQRYTQTQEIAKHLISVAKINLRGKKFLLNSGRYIEFTEAMIEFTDATGRYEGGCPHQKGLSLIKQAIAGSLKKVDNIPQYNFKLNEGKKIKSSISDYIKNIKNLIL